MQDSLKIKQQENRQHYFCALQEYAFRALNYSFMNNGILNKKKLYAIISGFNPLEMWDFCSPL